MGLFQRECWYLVAIYKMPVTHAGEDRDSHKVGHRWRYSHTSRTMACLGTHTRSTKDKTRSASDGISQSMPVQALR